MGLFPAGHRATHAACVVHCSSLRPGWYETWNACRHTETVSTVCQTVTSTFTSDCAKASCYFADTHSSFVCKAVLDSTAGGHVPRFESCLEEG